MLTVGPNLELLDYGNYGEPVYHETLRLYRAIDLLVQAHVKSSTTVNPPTSPEDGDAYIIPTGATGVWAGKTNQIARWTEKLPRNNVWDITQPDPQWEFFTPKINWQVGVDDMGVDGQILRFNGSDWVGGGSGGSYVLPVATASVLGGVKQGSNVTIDGGGTISVADPYVLQVATGSVLGGIKVGANLTIDGAGVLSANPGGYTLPAATVSTLGGIKVGANLTIDGAGVLSANAGSYTLPVATASVLGGVKQGNNVTIAGDGTISVADPYTLPVATSTVLGGVKQGSSITIDGAGVISVTTNTFEPLITKSTGYAKWNGTAWVFANETYSLSTHNHAGTYEPAITKSSGYARWNGTAWVFDSAAYTLPVATPTVLGGVKQGNNVTIAGDGTISVADPYTLPVATSSVLGGVKQGSNVTIDGAGVLSVTANTFFPVAAPNNSPVLLSRYTGGTNNPGLYTIMNEASNVGSLYSNTTLGLGGQSVTNVLEVTANTVTVNGTLNLTSKTTLDAIATPANPASGKVHLYAKSDGKVYSKNSSGVEFDLTATGGGGSATTVISNKTASYTVVAGDLGSVINCTSGTFTVNITAAATLGNGFNCWIWNTGTGVITIDPDTTETIDGKSTLLLRGGEGCSIVSDGTNIQTGDRKSLRGYSDNIGAAQTRPVASGSEDIAIGAQSSASGGAGIAIGYDASSSASRGTSIGCNSGANGSRVVTGAGAVAIGGSYASGADSFSAGGANNTGTYGATANASIAVGASAKASAISALAVGYATSAQGSYSTAIGNGASASGAYAVAINSAAASGVNSFALGSSYNGFGAATANALGTVAIGEGANTNSISGKISFGAGGATVFAMQAGRLHLGASTTNATPTALTSTQGAAATTNQLVLPNNSAYAFEGVVVARQQAAGGTASAAWSVSGLIRREGSAATTTLVASTVTPISNVPGWTLALSADTTNGGLAVTFTGAAATNIRAVATLRSAELTY